MRAEQNDLFRLKLCDQPLGHLLEKPLGQLFHLSLKLHQPAVGVGFEAALNAGNLVKQALGDPTDAAVVDGDRVSLVEQLADGGDHRRRSRPEDFLEMAVARRSQDFINRDGTLDNRNAPVGGQLKHGVAGNAGQDIAVEGRGDQAVPSIMKAIFIEPTSSI